MSKPTLALLLAMLAFAAFANAVGNGFVWDDPIILARQLPVFRGVASVLFPPPNIPQFAPDYYRPLVIASYLLDRTLGGGQPAAFHLTVVLAHVLATLAVFAFGDQLFLRLPLPATQAARAAALGSALFAVHPVHSEAVAWVAGRADVFAGLFAVTAAYAHLRSRSEARFAYAAAASSLAALLSKEVSAGLVLLLPLLDVLVPDLKSAAPGPRAQRRRGAAVPGAAVSAGFRYALIGAAVLVYAGLRLAAVQGGLRTTSGEPQSFRMDSLPAALAVYAGKLVAPIDLNAYIAELPSSGLVVGGGVAVAAAFLLATVVAWRRRRNAITFLLLWMAVTLAPALTVVLKIPEVPVAERYLYLPSVGFCLLLGYGAALGLATRSAALRFATIAATVLVLLASTWASARRSRIWASDLSLWTATVEKSTTSGMPWRSLGGALLAAGRLEEAQRALEESLERHNTPSGRITLFSNLGTIALTRGDLDGAERFYREALAVQQTPDVLYNLGVISLRRAHAAEGTVEPRHEQATAALRDLERAAAASPHDPDIELAVAEALTLLDRRADSRPHYERALALGLEGARAEQVRSLLEHP